MHEYEDWNRNNAPVTDPRRRCDHPGCGQTRAEHTGLRPFTREVVTRQDRKSANWRPLDEGDVVSFLLLIGGTVLAVLSILGVIPMR